MLLWRCQEELMWVTFVTAFRVPSCDKDKADFIPRHKLAAKRAKSPPRNQAKHIRLCRITTHHLVFCDLLCTQLSPTVNRRRISGRQYGLLFHSA